MRERIYADPAAVADPGRVEFELNADGGAVLIAEEGPRWGDAAIEAAMAEGRYGSTPVDHTVPNRQVEIPLLLVEGDDMTFEEGRRLVQSWVGLIQDTYRGWLCRELGSGRRIYLRIVNATLRLGGSSAQARGFADADAVLTLETLPAWFGDWQEAGSANSADGVLVSLGDVPGDYPAELRLRIENNTTVAQGGMIFAARPENEDATSAMAYAATSLTALGGATTRSGYVELSPLPPGWNAALSTDVAGVGPLSHVGLHAVWVLVTATAGTLARLEWAAGSVQPPEEKPLVRLNEGSTWVYLGQVNAPKARVGPQRWSGKLLFNGEGSAVQIRKLRVLPIADAYGVLNAPSIPAVPSSTMLAWDNFNGLRAGSLDGQGARLAGAWIGAGETGAIQANGSTASRSSAVASDISSGRFATLDVNAAGVDVLANVAFSSPPIPTPSMWDSRLGLVARWQDSRNWVVARAVQNVFGSVSLSIVKCVAGVVSVLASGGVGGSAGPMRFVVDSGGSALLYWNGSLSLQAADADLTAGGVLARGDVGLYDFIFLSGAGAIIHTFEDFSARVSPSAPDSLLFGSRSAELTSEGYARSDADGVAFGEVVIYGSLPRVPVGPAELFVQYARAIHGQALSSTAGDRITVTAHVRPCHLFTPDAS